MLIVNDRRLLGDGRLSSKESLLRYREGTERLLTDTYKLYDHDDLINLEKRRGEVMHSSELIRLVTDLNPTIWAEQQINFLDEWGFYTDINGKKTYLSAFHKDWVREFTALWMDHQ